MPILSFCKVFLFLLILPFVIWATDEWQLYIWSRVGGREARVFITLS
jgi:hypothetical protein